MKASKRINACLACVIVTLRERQKIKTVPLEIGMNGYQYQHCCVY